MTNTTINDFGNSLEDLGERLYRVRGAGRFEAAHTALSRARRAARPRQLTVTSGSRGLSVAVSVDDEGLIVINGIGGDGAALSDQDGIVRALPAEWVAEAQAYRTLYSEALRLVERAEGTARARRGAR